MAIDRAIALLAGTLAALVAGNAHATPAKTPPPASVAAAADHPRVFRSEGQGSFGGVRLRYAAAVEEFLLYAGGDTPGASVFVTSYVRRDVRDPTTRPILFVFNGGPGSASIWLHLGIMGPRRVNFDDPAHPRTVAPFSTVPNPDSPIDVADIVLIDPPGTG